MSEGGNGGLQNPYTLGAFQDKLNKFEELIRRITYQDEEATPEEKRQRITENLRYDQFCDQIKELFGPDLKNQDLKAIYRKITTNPDAKVDWSELFGYFQSGAEEEEMTVGEEISVFMVTKRKRVGDAAGDKKRRDSVQSLKHVPHLDAYLSASQKGALSIWSSKLKLQSCIDINEAAWVTGCDYLPVLRRVACCTERSIALWDNRAKGKVQQIFTIKPIEHSPQCMISLPISTSPHEDHILFGDDQGFVNLLTISVKDMTMKNVKGESKGNVQNNLVIEPGKLTYPIQRRKLHDDWVLQVKYFPDLRCFASCSASSTKSFFLEEIDRLNDNEELKGVVVSRGVNCFDYCARANIIATGGVDKIVRVWHPHIFSRPTGKLLGHLFTIVEIACNEKDQHIISLSTARVFRVWDIHTLTCLQVFTDNEERPGEKRIYAMLFDNKHDRLMTGSSVIDAWPLTRSVQDTMQVPHTHDRPISQILYNSELNQVISVCTESFMKVWDMETGKLVYNVVEAHGSGVEITAIALDKSGYRMVSGGYDGSIKIWDFGSGNEIKSKPGRGTEEDFSIVSLIYKKYQDDYIIIAAGWNNKIKLLLDACDNNDLSVTREFSDVYSISGDISFISNTSGDPFNSSPPLPSIGRNMAQVTNLFRKDYALSSNEVTCMSLVSNGADSETTVIATGTTNGSVVLWDVVSAQVKKVFELPVAATLSAQSRNRLTHSGEKRVNDIKVLVHTSRKIDYDYIKSLTVRHQKPSIKTDDDGLSTSDKLASDVSDNKSTNETDSVGTERVEVQSDHTKDDSKEISNEQQELPGYGKGEKVGKKVRHLDEVQKSSMVDPSVAMLVEIFDPLLVTVHQDACIRFWNMNGEILREITPLTRRQGIAITAVCHDADVNILITGDQKGYLTTWDVQCFMEDTKSQEPDKLKQIVRWRGHLTKVVSLVYVDGVKSLISSSTDGSLRVWWITKTAKFVGYFGQARPLSFPTTEDSAGNSTMPYDITERPLVASNRKKSAVQKIRLVQKFDYPLIFKQDKWRPFRRSAYLRPKSKPAQPEDKKFFGALIKPRAYNHHLQSSVTGEKMHGAVFRALPVYRVVTPERPKTPVINYPTASSEQSKQFVFGPAVSFKTSPVKVPNKRPGRLAMIGGATRVSVDQLKSSRYTPSPRKR